MGELTPELRMQTLDAQRKVNIVRCFIEGEERERRRISKDLHDGFASLVFSAIMRVSILKKNESSHNSQNELNEILAFLKQSERISKRRPTFMRVSVSK